METQLFELGQTYKPFKSLESVRFFSIVFDKKKNCHLFDLKYSKNIIQI